jgi:tight adherence protein B
VPARARHRVVRALSDADIDLDPETAVELWVITVLGVAVLASVIAPGLVAPAVVAAVAAGPLWLVFSRSRRGRRFAAALPTALEQVSAELRGGGTVNSAVERLATGDGAVAPDLRRIHRRAELGLSLTEALRRWPDEHDAPGVRATAGAFAVASTLGGNAADAIEGLATSLRNRLDAAAEAHALSSQARLSAVVVGAAPVGYLLVASLVDPRSVGVLVGTGVGRICFVVGLALDGLAALWIRHIVKVPA